MVFNRRSGAHAVATSASVISCLGVKRRASDWRGDNGCCTAVAASLAAVVASLACLAFALMPSVGRAQSALVPLTGEVTETSSSGVLLAGPVLEGATLVWALTGPGGTEVVDSETPGQAPVALGSLPRGHGAPSLALAASPQQLIVGRTLSFCSSVEACKYMQDNYTYGYWRAVAGGKLSALAGPQFPPVHVSGEWLGYIGAEGRFEVSDPFAPSVAPVSAASISEPVVSHPALAYPYVASISKQNGRSAAVTVTDIQTGAVVLSVPEGPGGSTYGSEDLDALQTDGTLVVNAPHATGTSTSRLPGGLPGWASPSEPSVHPLDALDGANDITIAGGLIAGTLWPAGEGARGRLRVVNLAGKVIAESTVNTPVGDVAFDGEQLAWAQQPCMVTYASVWNLSEARPPAPDARCAVVHLSVPSAAQRRHGSDLYLTVNCPESAAATGCPGKLLVSARRAGKVGPGAQGLAILGHHSYALTAGQRRRLAIRLNRKVRRFLAAGKVIVTAQAIAHRATGERPADDPGMASVRFTLTPPSTRARASR